MSDILYQALFRIMREGTSLGDGHDVTMTRAAIIADEALRAHAIAIEARSGETGTGSTEGKSAGLQGIAERTTLDLTGEKA